MVDQDSHMVDPDLHMVDQDLHMVDPDPHTVLKVYLSTEEKNILDTERDIEKNNIN